MAASVAELDDYSRKLGKAMRQLRQHREWSQEHLSEVSRIDRSTITQVENGRNCYVLTVATLLHAMHYSWDDVTRVIRNSGV